MNSWSNFFKGKKVTVMGLGLLGRGVGDIAFLAGLGAHLTVTDLKSEEELAPSLKELQGLGITFVLGKHDLGDFTNADMVIKAAGVPLDSPYITAAENAGIPVYMSTALFGLFAKEMGVVLAGVTGTRGKSTVAHLMHHALTRAGRTSYLAGNVRGVSTLALLPRMKAGDIAVLELDSWQLQGFGDIALSPSVAVFTNLKQDHLNYYKNDTERYFADKANIFKYQKEGDTLVVGADIAEKINAAHPPVVPIVPAPIPSAWTLQIVGNHNRENAALAALALHALGLSAEEIKEGLESFAPVEGRLQFVREVRGVRIYNDNNATTPEATLEALKALATGERNIVLIMGGADKELDMGPLLIAIPQYVKRLVMLAGTGTNRILEHLPGASVYDSLSAALAEALHAAHVGDIVLFSPAFASFGVFKNEYDRNDQFLSIVRGLK